LLPSEALLRQLHDFIELNRADLFAFDRDPDQGGISGAEMMRRLRKLPPNDRCGEISMDPTSAAKLVSALDQEFYALNSADANENLTHGRGIDRRWEGQDGVTT
jgi:hypothetical protein